MFLKQLRKELNDDGLEFAFALNDKDGSGYLINFSEDVRKHITTRIYCIKGAICIYREVCDRVAWLKSESWAETYYLNLNLNSPSSLEKLKMGLKILLNNRSGSVKDYLKYGRPKF